LGVNNIKSTLTLAGGWPAVPSMPSIATETLPLYSDHNSYIILCYSHQKMDLFSSVRLILLGYLNIISCSKVNKAKTQSFAPSVISHTTGTTGDLSFSANWTTQSAKTASINSIKFAPFADSTSTLKERPSTTTSTIDCHTKQAAMPKEVQTPSINGRKEKSAKTQRERWRWNKIGGWRLAAME